VVWTIASETSASSDDAATITGVKLDVTLIIIASVGLVSLLAWAVKPLKLALILRPSLVRERFQVHRLLTAGWVHADTTHLLFNLFTLYAFAATVEKTIGPVYFAGLYVTAVVASFLPTTLLHMGDPKYSSLGASGAVAAVMFSAILLYPTMRVGVPFIPVGVSGPIYAVGYLAYSVLNAFRSSDGVNHEAHFAGALYGVLVTYILLPHRVEAALHHLF
jgi:membrane associated rhomboid family serine protease